MSRLALLAGLAAGYVLGTRAGRQRYEAIAAAARRFADRPDVQSAAGTVAGQVSSVVRTARSARR